MSWNIEWSTKKQNKEKRKELRIVSRNLWDNIKLTNIWIIGGLVEEKKKKGSEKIFEVIVSENFPERKRNNQV